VVFLPGTGGVPQTFENFVQNAANLGFHALALTHDNDTSLASLCAADVDPDCYFKVRYEFLTGSNTTTKATVTRPNSIEFRLAAFLNWLNTNNPADGWDQFLTATNAPWTNALAWDKFLFAGHSQGSGYAGFIGKLHEVQRVVMFAGGDWWLLSNQPPAWASLPSATPPERWFHFTHYFDPGEFEVGQQIPAWEAFGQMTFAPVVNVDYSAPPYGFAHALTSLREPCTNLTGQVDFHNGTVNDPRLVRDLSGIPLYATVWTHMLTGAAEGPATANLLADSVRGFSSSQGSAGWFYGYWNRTLDGPGGYQPGEFRSLTSSAPTLFVTPGWVLSNVLQVAIWQTGQRPHGVNTNACCTNWPSGPELWPVRRWISSVSGPVVISGSLAKWDSAGGDGIVGLVKVDGVTVWSGLIEGTNFSIGANVSVGSRVDFLVSPGLGANADQDGTYFTALIAAAPAAPWPMLYVRSLGSNVVELTREGRTNYSYQIERTITLGSWQAAGRPVPAPAAPGWMTNIQSIVTNQTFFRLVATPLTTSPVPTMPGTYANLSLASGGIARSYRLNIPTNYTGGAPAPLAFILHGHGQTADSFALQHPDLASLANNAGMILVIPQSTTSERGTGWINFIPEPGAAPMDDVAFVLDLLEHVAATLNVDRQRAFAGGLPNGGQLVHYLGARTTNVFAAFASVGSAIGGGAGGSNLVYAPLPSAPTPILIVNATNDCTRPFWGGLNTDGQLQPSVQEAVDHWTTNVNACFNTPIVTTNYVATNFVQLFIANRGGPCPPPAQLIANLVIRSTWLGCSNWVEVAQVTLTDGGHLWPDAGDNVGFDANREVLEFFLRHCRCDAPGATNPLVTPPAPGTYERSFCDQGYWRKFRLMIPTGYTGATQTPLLFTFHGGEQTIAEFGGQHPDLFAKCNA
jgi:poly(3-hydroxybutyrate) depolymerase